MYIIEDNNKNLELQNLFSIYDRKNNVKYLKDHSLNKIKDIIKVKLKELEEIDEEKYKVYLEDERIKHIML